MPREQQIAERCVKALYDSFDNRTLLNMGINWKYEISVLTLGFAMIGHQIHHLKVIEEKYFPLLDQPVSNATTAR